MVVHSAKRQGAQGVALSHARSLADDHALVIAIGEGPLRAEFAQLGSLIHEPSRAPIWGASRLRWSIDMAKVLPDAIRLVRAARRDEVVAIVANSTVLVAPVLAARWVGIPVIVCAHEGPKSKAARRLFRFHGAFADTVIAMSSWVAAGFGTARARVVTSPPGIPVPPWRERPVRAVDAPLRLLVAGTIDEHKRQDVAIRAMRQLIDAGVTAELEIVGRVADSRYAASLAELADQLGVSHCVNFAGERSDLPEYMRAVDVLVVPAGEVTPLVMMEAMAAGTPVVAARMGSIPDVVEDGDSGILFEPGSADALAEAIRWIDSEPRVAEMLSRNGRARVEARFDESYSAETLRAELDRVLGTKRCLGSTLA